MATRLETSSWGAAMERLRGKVRKSLLTSAGKPPRCPRRLSDRSSLQVRPFQRSLSSYGGGQGLWTAGRPPEYVGLSRPVLRRICPCRATVDRVGAPCVPGRLEGARERVMAGNFAELRAHAHAHPGKSVVLSNVRD
jgi:hypothetical protein